MSEPKIIKAIQSLSLDAKIAHERLKKTAVGEVVSYSELGQLIGRDSQGEGRGVINTARRKALREDGMVFGCVHGEGLKRLSDIEIVATCEHIVTKIRRCSTRGFWQITAVKDFAALPNESKIRHNVYASLLGAFAQATSAPRIKKLEVKIIEAKTQLPLTKTLEAFRD